jgi:GMP synthase (glutamine-hydrolysing)
MSPSAKIDFLHDAASVAAPDLSATSSLRPVLIVLHQETSTPGRIGNALRALGYRLDIRRPRFGDALPDTLAEHAGVVVFGGPMSANDPDDYIRREIDWIAVPLLEQRPYLGICLGAQLLARQLGARVVPHPQGRVEMGFYPIRPTQAGLRLCTRWPDQVYHWHGEGFGLPAGSELLAEGDDFPVQAFRYGNAFGVQFHPDVTTRMMCRWTTVGAERLVLLGAQPRAQHFAGRACYDLAERLWLKHFLDGWLSRVPEPMMAQAAE